MGVCILPNPPGQARVSFLEASNFKPYGLDGAPGGTSSPESSGHAVAIMNRRTSEGAVTPNCSPFPMIAGRTYRKVPGLDFGSHPGTN